MLFLLRAGAGFLKKCLVFALLCSACVILVLVCLDRNWLAYNEDDMTDLLCIASDCSSMVDVQSSIF